MKKSFASTVAGCLLALSCTAAFGADMMPRKAVAAPPPPPPSPWDLAFGASGTTDYIWRGITQSNHKPSVTAYTELRYNVSPALQFYGGMAGNSISFPNRAAGEFDFFGGFRPTFGPIALDFGAQYYYYPGGQCYGGQFVDPNCLAALPNGNSAKKDWSFWEVYSKGVWTINDQWALGYNVFGTSNILNTGASGTYVSGTVKWTAPSTMAWNGVGWYVSGEFGEQFLGTSDSFYGIAGTQFVNGVPYADYGTWNVGVGFTWKVFTLDLRYYDTNLSQANCNVYTSDNTAIGFVGSSATTATNPTGVGSHWCDARFVAKLSFDMTLGALK